MYFTMRAQSVGHPWNGSDRAWLCRWLEVTTASLQELHLMRQDAEQRVRGVLEEEQRSHETRSMKWQRDVSAEYGMTWVASVASTIRRNPDMDHSRLRSPELGHIQEEVTHVRPEKNKVEESLKDKSSAQALGLDHHWKSASNKSQERNVAPSMEGSQVRATPAKGANPSKSIEEDFDLRPWMTLPRHNQDRMDFVPTTINERSTWTRPDATEPTLNPVEVKKTEEQSEESPAATEGSELPLSAFPAELSPLRRIGSGSLAPRLRLGSSGVTSDILFTRRMSGNCLSAHSSGFYETSDLDSISSSCSSLCSDTSCHTSSSVMSPQRSFGMRPRSIDYTAERRKELQNGRIQAKRPMSAGAVDGLFLPSISNSRCDINHMTYCDYPLSETPSLCVIQQRRKAERYICKMALKYRCKPGVTTLPADLGPQTPRRVAQPFLQPDGHGSCPPSPQVSSLSSSLGDVRKPPKGSWGRFFSRVALKRDSRTAASELNLVQCGQSLNGSLRGSSLADSQLLRAKSFRDLLSINPFKRSQRGLNKAW